MLDEHPDPQGQQGLPQQPGKIVLPAQSNTPYPPAARVHHPYGNSTSSFPTRPGPFKPVSPPPFARTKKGTFWTVWRSDPAYKILALALGVVLIIGIIFAIIAGNVFASMFRQGGTAANGPTGPIPQSTGALNSTLPTPTVNQSSSSNTPPAMTPTPIVQPTATPFPTPTPAPTPTVPPTPTPTPSGTFTLQITHIPATVHNYNTVPVDVVASQGGVNVKLVISYNASPGSATVGPQKTNANGDVTLYWFVMVRQDEHTPVTAQITAIAYTQDGQQVSSPTVTVQIRNFGSGG